MNHSGDAARAASLREERDLLLRSLDELDSERAAGDLEESDYSRLRVEYTRRAASVIRELDDLGEEAAGDVATTQDPVRHEVDTQPSPARQSWRARVAVIVVIVIFVGGSAAALTAGLRDRDEGQTLTGNAQSDGTELTMPPAVAAELERLETAAAENPDDYDAQYEYAAFVEVVDPVTALEYYDAATRADATRPEAPAAAGWIVIRAAADARDEAERRQLLASGIERVDEAIARDPRYLPAYAYKGMALNAGGDPSAAIPLLDRYLESAPADDPLREGVEQIRDDAIAAAESS